MAKSRLIGAQVLLLFPAKQSVLDLRLFPGVRRGNRYRRAAVHERRA